MKVKYDLNESDILDIIANHYSTDIDNVTLSIVPVTEGYGMNEHQKLHIQSTVSLTSDKSNKDA